VFQKEKTKYAMYEGEDERNVRGARMLQRGASQCVQAFCERTTEGEEQKERKAYWYFSTRTKCAMCERKNEHNVRGARMSQKGASQCVKALCERSAEGAKQNERNETGALK